RRGSGHARSGSADPRPGGSAGRSQTASSRTPARLDPEHRWRRPGRPCDAGVRIWGANPAPLTFSSWLTQVKSEGTSMKMAIAALAGLLLAGTYGASPAQAQWGPGYSTQTQTAPAPRYDRRYGEPGSGSGYGSEMRERCAGLHRES